MLYIGKNLLKQENLRKKITELFFRGRHYKVLVDAGCGNGNITNTIAQHAAEMWGIDRYCEPPAHQNFQFCKIDSDRYPFDSSSVDCVTLLEVIEHQENPDALLKEIYRILKPNGVLILSTPNLKSLQRELYFSAWLRGRKQKYPVFPLNLNREPGITHDGATHFQEYTLKEIKDILIKYGFKIKTVRGVFFGFMTFYKKYFVAIGSDTLARLFPNLAQSFFIEAKKAVHG